MRKLFVLLALLVLLALVAVASCIKTGPDFDMKLSKRVETEPAQEPQAQPLISPRYDSRSMLLGGSITEAEPVEELQDLSFATETEGLLGGQHSTPQQKGKTSITKRLQRGMVYWKAQSPVPSLNSIPKPTTHITENAFRNVLNHPLSTFSVDVDSASYANMRRFINSGQLPPKDSVRIEELVNYFPLPL